MQYVNQAPIDPLTFEVYPSGPFGAADAEGSSSRDYYEDDGISFDFQQGVSLEQKVSMDASRDTLEIHMTARQGSYAPPPRKLLFKIHAERQEPSSVAADGQTLERKTSMDALDKTSSGWTYDEDGNVVSVKIPDSSQRTAIRLAFAARN